MTNDFKKMAEHCQLHKLISDKVLDQFLMIFISKRERMVQKMDTFKQKYGHIIRKMPGDFFPRAMAEYIMGKTLAPDGLIHKYLDHPQLLSQDEAERRLLEFLAGNPWRYCFAHIADHPAPNFFLLSDAFLGDEFLLYSPGIENYWGEGRERDLYFLLTGFNGLCWHTYGVIVPMKSFTPDDIYFYGTEVFPEVDSDATLLDSVYKDPMPYMMLASGMEYPVMMNSGNLIRHWVAVDAIDSIDTEALKKQLSIRWNKDIYRISHKKWTDPPHFATAYFNENSCELTRYAMTETGFRELTRILINAGLPIGQNEDYSVGVSMMMTMEDILKRKIHLHEYETFFPEKNDNPISQKELDKINRFMNLLLPYINAGKQPDLNVLAQHSGIDSEEAQNLYEQLRSKFGGKVR